MYKVRVASDENKVEEPFSSKTSAFDWVKKNCQKNTVFSLYQYEAGSLSTMDRYSYDGHRISIEIINCNWREFSLSDALKARKFQS